MRTFNDAKGRQWEIAVNAGTVIKVHTQTGIHLPGLFGDELKGYVDFLDDPIKQARVLWSIARAPTDKGTQAAVSEADFLEALNGDAMADAVLALEEELISFFPQKAKREGIRSLLRKWQQIGESLTQKGIKALDKIDIEKTVAHLENGLTTPSSVVPESSESTPAHSP